MKKFSNLKSIPSYLSLQNIDTDMIIPKQFLKTIKRTGLGKSLFYGMRYDENGKTIENFILNKEPYNKSKILLSWSPLWFPQQPLVLALEDCGNSCSKQEKCLTSRLTAT